MLRPAMLPGKVLLVLGVRARRGRSRRGTGIHELFARIHAKVPWSADGSTGGWLIDTKQAMLQSCGGEGVVFAADGSSDSQAKSSCVLTWVDYCSHDNNKNNNDGNYTIATIAA